MFMSLLITAHVTVTDYYGAAEDSLARRHICCQAKRTAASGLLARWRASTAGCIGKRSKDNISLGGAGNST